MITYEKESKYTMIKIRFASILLSTIVGIIALNNTTESIDLNNIKYNNLTLRSNIHQYLVERSELLTIETREVAMTEVSVSHVPEYKIEFIYPTDVEDTYINKDYVPFIYEAAEAYNICPELIIAIIERESSGKATVSSPSGACKGLMQIYEKYHVARMEKLGVTDLFDPEGNIWVGVDYLSELINKYQNVEVALMVYNGDKRAFEDGYVSNYAREILSRSCELEELYYGTPVLIEVE